MRYTALYLFYEALISVSLESEQELNNTAQAFRNFFYNNFHNQDLLTI